MEIYLIRHTTPNIPDGVCYGQSDVELAETFPEELEEIKNKLPNIEGNVVLYSSPLQRCSSLARQLYPKKRLITDERLMELDFGNWELKKWDDIDSGSLRHWMRNFDSEPCPGGESYEQLNLRVLKWWVEMTSKDHNQVIVVCHGGVIRSLLSHILKIPLKNSFCINIFIGSIAKIIFKNKRTSINFVNK